MSTMNVDNMGKNMVKVPGGEFVRDSKSYSDSIPVKSVYVDAFMIGKYPVTNQEYKVFLEDGGCRHTEFWTEEGLKWSQVYLRHYLSSVF